MRKLFAKDISFLKACHIQKSDFSGLRKNSFPMVTCVLTPNYIKITMLGKHEIYLTYNVVWQNSS